MRIIPYGRHYIDKTDINQVVKVLKSDWITQGPKVKEFEEALAKYCGARYVVAVSSGTAALHLACLAAGLKRGDEAITTPITFVATCNSILYTGAKPVFADIDYDTVNIDPQKIKERITKKTKAILPVHFAGLPCDMPEISRIAKENKLVVIEDACHALGAGYKYNGRWIKVGSCRHSDMVVFSFHPVKSITTGEGGAVLTNRRDLYERLLMLRHHGITKNPKGFKHNPGPWYYEMRYLGFNYRITDIQCALGISQLKRLGVNINKREKIASTYNKNFSNLLGLIELPPAFSPDKRSAWHLYIIRLKDKNLIRGKTKLFLKMQDRKIHLQLHYIPVYRQPYYRKNVSFGLNLANAERYYAEALSLPIYPTLTYKQQDYVIANFTKIVKELSKK